MPPFHLFGPAHLAALLLVLLTAAGLAALVRHHPSCADTTRRLLAVLLAALAVTVLVLERRAGTPWTELAPLHLCDAAVGVAVWALLTLRPLACELLYFWGCSGTVLALLTPDLAEGFPHPHFFSYFGLHGGVVVAGVLVVAGLGRAPRPGAVGRALLGLNLYALAVAGVDVVTGANFLYLRAKPGSPTPLDWFGPWPLYILVAEGVALGLFTLLALPFRPRR